MKLWQWLKKNREKATYLEPHKNKEKQIHRFLKRMQVGAMESSMIEGVMLAQNINARDIMVPRVDVFALEVEMSKSETMELVAASNHSRFPVYSGNIDNIVGVLHLRDIFKSLLPRKKNFSLGKLTNEPYFIPESRHVLDVLEDLQKRHLQIAIVVDEYGGFAGIVTMEDILEEIIGDVQDEWDNEAAPITKTEHNAFSLDPRISLKEANEKLGFHLDDGKAETLGGFIINLFGRLPKTGESVKWDGLTFTVKSKKKNTIHRLLLQSSKSLDLAEELQNTSTKPKKVKKPIKK